MSTAHITIASHNLSKVRRHRAYSSPVIITLLKVVAFVNFGAVLFSQKQELSQRMNRMKTTSHTCLFAVMGPPVVEMNQEAQYHTLRPVTIMTKPGLNAPAPLVVFPT